MHFNLQKTRLIELSNIIDRLIAVLSLAVRASGAGLRVHVPRASEREQDVDCVLSERATLQLYHAENLPRANRPLWKIARREDRRSDNDDIQAGERTG